MDRLAAHHEQVRGVSRVLAGPTPSRLVYAVHSHPAHEVITMSRPRVVHVRHRRLDPGTPAGRRQIIRKTKRRDPWWVAALRARIAELRAVDHPEAK